LLEGFLKYLHRETFSLHKNKPYSIRFEVMQLNNPEKFTGPYPFHVHNEWIPAFEVDMNTEKPIESLKILSEIIIPGPTGRRLYRDSTQLQIFSS